MQKTSNKLQAKYIVCRTASQKAKYSLDCKEDMHYANITSKIMYAIIKF